MRWKNGAPKKLYVVVNQENGGIYSYETKKYAHKWFKYIIEEIGSPAVLVTFVQEEK